MGRRGEDYEGKVQYLTPGTCIYVWDVVVVVLTLTHRYDAVCGYRTVWIIVVDEAPYPLVIMRHQQLYTLSPPVVVA